MYYTFEPIVSDSDIFIAKVLVTNALDETHQIGTIKITGGKHLTLTVIKSEMLTPNNYIMFFSQIMHRFPQVMQNVFALNVVADPWEMGTLENAPEGKTST